MSVTKENAIEAVVELWVGSSRQQMQTSEYFRGQIELITDLFDHDWENDPDREALMESIIAKVTS